MRVLDSTDELGNDLWGYETRVSPLGTLGQLLTSLGHFYFSRLFAPPAHPLSHRNLLTY